MSNEVVYQNDEFYISYLAKPSDLANSLDLISHKMGAPPPTGDAETALVVKNKLEFYILYGDHRRAYLNICYHGLNACMKYFIENIEQISHSSDCLPLNS